MMKRAIWILIIAGMCLSLCACSKSEAATKVDNMISEIGEVTLESGAKITAAEEAADELKESEYNQLEQISVLKEARKTYDQLMEEKRIEENKAAIAELESAIDSIGTVTLEQESVISDIRKQYNRANKEVQAGVSNYKMLEQAEEQLSNLKVQNVINLIDQIGQVTLNSEEAINAAKSTYNKLSSDEKTRVTNYDSVEAASQKLQELKMEKRVKNIVRVTKLQVSKPNSVGGVSVYIGFKNMSDKVIKYITFEVVPYNAVGDIMRCEIRDYANFGCQATGPYATGEGIAGNNSAYWDCAWYNSTIASIQLRGIDIEYMDGTSVSLSGNELNYVIY